MLAERFWQGLADLALSLGDTQQAVLDLEDAGPEPEAVRAQLGAMQVRGAVPPIPFYLLRSGCTELSPQTRSRCRSSSSQSLGPDGAGHSAVHAVPQALREEIDSLQQDLDSLGTLGVELMSACGDSDKPDVTKSLDDVSARPRGAGRRGRETCPRGARALRLRAPIASSRPAALLVLAQPEQGVGRAQRAPGGAAAGLARLPGGHAGERRGAAGTGRSGRPRAWRDCPSRPATPQRLVEWLDAAELRIAEEFLVGGDLEMVRRQLAELKVGAVPGPGPHLPPLLPLLPMPAPAGYSAAAQHHAPVPR